MPKAHLPLDDRPVRPTPVVLPKKFARHTNHFYVPSSKAGRYLDMASELETDHWAVVEIDPLVVDVCEQPQFVEGELDGKPSGYVFDLWIRWQDGREKYRDVKPSKYHVRDSDGNLVPPKWPLAVDWARRNRREIDWVTEHETYSNVLLVQNARHCVTYAWQAFLDDDPEIRERILTSVAERNALPLHELEYALRTEDSNRVRAHTVYLIVHGQLYADLGREPFGRDLVIRHGISQAA
jgi:hypothetical protein